MSQGCCHRVGVIGLVSTGDKSFPAGRRRAKGAYGVFRQKFRCGVDRGVLKREAKRLARLVQKHAAAVAMSADDQDDERVFAQQIAQFVLAQAVLLEQEATAASRIKAEFL